MMVGLPPLSILSTLTTHELNSGCPQSKTDKMIGKLSSLMASSPGVDLLRVCKTGSAEICNANPINC